MLFKCRLCGSLADDGDIKDCVCLRCIDSFNNHRFKRVLRLPLDEIFSNFDPFSTPDKIYFLCSSLELLKNLCGDDENFDNLLHDAIFSLNEVIDYLDEA